MSLDKEVRKLVRDAQRQGFRVRETKKGWMVYGKEPAKGAVLLHKTPSDQRSLRNDVARLRRIGFERKRR